MMWEAWFEYEYTYKRDGKSIWMKWGYNCDNINSQDGSASNHYDPANT